MSGIERDLASGPLVPWRSRSKRLSVGGGGLVPVVATAPSARASSVVKAGLLTPGKSTFLLLAATSLLENLRFKELQ